VVLVDLDPGGGGLDVLLGVEQVPGARWSDLRHTGSGVEAGPLLGALPHWRGVAVVSQDRLGRDDGRPAAGPPPAVVGAVLDAVTGGGGLVVLDASARGARAGAGTDEVWAAAASRTDVSVLVTAQDVVGVAAALGVRSALGGGRGALVLRSRRAPVVAPVEAAQALGLRHVATLPSDRSVGPSTDRGLGPVPGRALARAVAEVDASCAPTPSRRPGGVGDRREASRTVGGRRVRSAEGRP
jgi:hypothetical protein